MDEEVMETRTPVTKEHLKSLKKLLKPESHRWFQLGVQMRLSMDELKKIQKQSGSKPPDMCFMEILNLFLNQEDSKKKWKNIFDALEDINNNRLKRTLEKQYKDGDIVSEDVDSADLARLLADVTSKWFMFGQYLDISVPKLNEIKEARGPDDCFAEMIQLWFENGEFATFEIVIEALESISNKVLARKVKEEFLSDIKEPVDTPVVTWLTGIDRKVLTRENDTTDVIEAIGINVTNWQNFGLALRIKEPQLESIKYEYRDRVSDCRREVIKEWLKSGLATWESLCIALAKEYVGHRGLAKKIADDHRILVQPDESGQDQPGNNFTQIELSNPLQEEHSSIGSSKLVGGGAMKSDQPVAFDSNEKNIFQRDVVSSVAGMIPQSYSKPVQATTTATATSTPSSFGYRNPITNNDEHDQMNVDNVP